MQPARNRILCVDDHEDSRGMMKVLLEMWNYEVALADTADDGFYLARSELFDLYLLDTHLPDGSAFELCEQICGVSGHAPVVLISTAPYEADKQRGSHVGAIAYLTKPLDFEVLEATLTRDYSSPWRGFGKSWGAPYLTIQNFPSALNCFFSSRSKIVK
jgi:DNA-binding response OmpR family regulator